PAPGVGITYTVTGTAPVVAPVSNATGVFGGLTPGLYEITTNNSSGCVSSIVEIVIIEPPLIPSAPIIGTITQPTCNSPVGSVIMSELPSGNWIINPGRVTGSTAITTIAGLNPGTYNFTVTNSYGCISAPSTDVLITPTQITLQATPTAVTCTGNKDGKIDLSVSCGAPPYKYEWTGPAGFTSIAKDLVGLSGGLYKVTVTDVNGFVGATSVNVNESTVVLSLSSTSVPETRKMSIDGTIILGVTGGSINLTVSGGTAPFSYSWSGPNNYIANTEDPSDLLSGTYAVTVTDVNGCMKTISVIVDVQVVLSQDDTCVLFIPNVFTPNGDGIHDYFEISCLYNYTNAEIEIFNRNGNLLFKKDHYGNIDYWGSKEKAFWNGRSENSLNFMGSELPVGTYYYILRLTNGGVSVHTGFVFLGR
ncbi:MAG: gliding motility-associated C-terminal domain-containing protein, partial [Mariniphaga sp.]